MSRRKDWAADQAKRIVALCQGLSPEVTTTYIASELRLAHSRGAIEASKPKPAAEKKLV